MALERGARGLSSTATGDIGLDVKYGVTENLVADFTVNIDFAQVEADEQQVNLTRFSLFFPEKREFHLDYMGDRYGLQLERLNVGDDFNPEVGFLRRDDFARSFGSARFSPRPESIAAHPQANLGGPIRLHRRPERRARDAAGPGAVRD